MGPARRRAIVTTAPWRRAPVLVLRRPGVLVAVAAATGVLVAAVAGVPLFLSSVGAGAVVVQAEERCSSNTGATTHDLALAPGVDGVPGGRDLAGGSIALDANGRVPPAFAPLSAELGPEVAWTTFETSLTGPRGEVPVAVLARTGALDHVRVVDEVPGGGVWVSDRGAQQLGVGAGDAVRLAAGGPRQRVAGVYADLAGYANPPDPFWCLHPDLLVSPSFDIPLPPPVVLVEPAQLPAVAAAAEVDAVVAVRHAPLRERALTPGDLDGLVDELACRGPSAGELEWCAWVSADPASDGGVAYRTPGPEPDRTFRDADAFVQTAFASSMPFVADRTRSIQASVRGGVLPLAGFAALAGAALVAAAGSLWFDRRWREVQLLAVRGVGPLALGVKGALELIVPLMVGGALGLAGASVAVRGLGPSPLIERGAVRTGALAAALTTVGAALIVVAVVAGRSRAADRGRARAGVLRLVPWEVLLAVATWISYRRLGEWGVPVAQGAEVTPVDVVGLLFPLLFLLTGVALAARVLALALGPARAATRGAAPPLFLATRRLARSRSAALGIVGASAVAAGVLGYSATLTRSLEATLDAKARTFVGSDVVAVLADGEDLPPSLAGRATEVRVFRSARLGERRPTEVKVLAVDPATFARGAFWDETMAGPPLDEILDRLAAPASGRPTPVVVVGLDAGATTELRLDGGGAEGVTVEPVTELDAFPGMARTTPTVVIDRHALEGARGGAVETFVAGDPPQILDALADAGVTFQQDRVVADVVDRAAFVTVTWTFGYMQTLGVAAGLLVAVGLAVHVDARRRSRVLGYAFARRMGLSPRAHRTALLLELLAMVSVGSCVGLACAYLGAAVAHGRIDPVPGFAPDPLLRPDLVVGAAVALGSVVVAAVGAVVAQRLADRDDPVEVLRAGV